MLPNFLIIGAARSGTSSLYAYLQETPDIYLPRDKRPEPHFFFKNSEYAKGLAYYEERHFSDWQGETTIGEASTSYIFGPETPARIHAHLPDVRLIAMLRNPLERAFSNYWHSVKSGLETLSFDEAIACEDERTAALVGTELAEIKPFSYLARGLYHEQLVRWYDVFDSRQLHIVLLDDFIADTHAALNGILLFLQADTKKLPQKLDRKENRSSPDGVAIPVTAKKIMLDYFAADLHKLERLLSRDLTGWLT